PEPQKRTERERKENAVVTANTGHLIDPRPTRDHPVPTLRSIQPAHRFAGGAAGLMKAAVLLHRVREVGPKRWIRGLIVDQLRLEGKRDAATKFKQALGGLVHTCLAQLRGIEAVGGQELPHQRLNLFRLVSFDGRPVERSRRHAPNASAGATAI